MKLFRIAALSLLWSTPALADGGDQNIIGGSTTTVGQFPTVVALQLDVPSGGLCTGTLIAPEWVVTAAHCLLPSFQGFSNQQALTDALTIIVDSVNSASGGQRLSALQTIPHPVFRINALGDNDIGLVRLAAPITDRPVTPVNRNGDGLIGLVVDMVGYGQTAFGSGEGTQHVLADRTAVSCATYFLSNNTLMCYAQSDGKGRCTGDSGGPSLSTVNGVETLVSLASFVGQDCGQYGADTRVDAEMAFLEEHIGVGLQCVHDGVCGFGCGGLALPPDQDCACTGDAGCSGGNVCDVDRCVPAPLTTGGLGAACLGGDECASGECTAVTEGMICSKSCTADPGVCPAGFSCQDASGQSQCLPEVPAEDSGGGGCAAGRSPGFGALLLLLLAVLGRRRSIRA